MKSTKRRILACGISLFLILQSGIAVTAAQQEEVVPQGGLSKEQLAQSNEEILAEILADPALSEAQKQQAVEKMYYEPDPVQKMTRMPAGFWMGYDPIMQQDDTKCAPATIQQSLQILFTFQYVPESQTTIQNKVGRGPGLDTVLSYLNGKQSRINMVRKRVANLSELNNCLYWSFNNKGPVVFTLAADTTFWRYKTPGHFTNLAGYASDGTYLLVDPYYYTRYVPSYSDAKGTWWVTPDALWTANTRLFDVGNNTIGY